MERPRESSARYPLLDETVCTVLNSRMASTTGRDVILTLMTEVAELQANSLAAAQHLEQLVKLAKDSAKRNERIARTLSKLADFIGDHEARSSSLEARQ